MLTNSGVAPTRVRAKKIRRLFTILFIGDEALRVAHPAHRLYFIHTLQEAENRLTHLQPDLILISAQLGHEFGKHLNSLKEYGQRQSIPIVLYSENFGKLHQNIALKFGFDEYYFGDLSKFFFKKIRFYKKLKAFKCSKPKGISRLKHWNFRKVNFLKRVIDIIAATLLLTILLPLFIIVAVIVKLESSGSVFYVSRRAGFGYRIFNFYKFRSMRSGADKQLDRLREHNQYGDSAFFKMQNDPRVTPFGNFLRFTSLDELPQLINVLKGDMSLVGNRPLPLYEAERLTQDETAGRFLAPAGITGLWQITKRGRRDVSERERIKLDITYARKWSVAYDLKIMIGTLPALFQKEPV